MLDKHHLTLILSSLLGRSREVSAGRPPSPQGHGHPIFSRPSPASRSVSMSDPWLPEDPDERRSWDHEVQLFGGDPLASVALALRMMSIVFPSQGSLAKRCAIMSNEVAKAQQKGREKR